MCLLVLAIHVGVFVRTFMGGSLEAIDEDRQCVIWSDDSHGCTCYSASFAELKGEMTIQVTTIDTTELRHEDIGHFLEL